MKEQNRRLLTPALVIVGCIALLLVVIALASRSGSGDDSAAIGFPIVLAGLAVVSVVGMLVWKPVSKKSHRESALRPVESVRGRSGRGGQGPVALPRLVSATPPGGGARLEWGAAAQT